MEAVLLRISPERSAELEKPVDAGLTDFAVFEVACGLNAIGFELLDAGFGKIAPSRIADENSRAACLQCVKPGKKPLGERSLVAHVADQNRLPAVVAVDDVFVRDLDMDPIGFRIQDDGSVRKAIDVRRKDTSRVRFRGSNGKQPGTRSKIEDAVFPDSLRMIEHV